MNCQPGDVAYVVRSTSRLHCFASAIGTPIETTTAVMTPFGTAWRYKGGRLHCVRCGTRFRAFLDADLQPVRKTPSANQSPAERAVELAA